MHFGDPVCCRRILVMRSPKTGHFYLILSGELFSTCRCSSTGIVLFKCNGDPVAPGAISEPWWWHRTLQFPLWGNYPRWVLLCIRPRLKEFREHTEWDFWGPAHLYPHFLLQALAHSRPLIYVRMNACLQKPMSAHPARLKGAVVSASPGRWHSSA